MRRQFDADPLGTLQRVADLGYESVELVGFAGRAEYLARLLAETGLRAVSGHAHLLDAPDVPAILRDAALLGLEAVIDPAIGREHWATGPDIERSASRFTAVADLAETAGLLIGYHNHEWELQSTIGDRSGLEVFAGALDPRVVLEVDTFWAEVGGVSAPALLTRLGSRVRYLHMKDGPRTRDTMTQVPLGQGTLDVPAIISAAPTAHLIVEFDDHDGDIFEAVDASRRFIAEGEAR